MKKNSKKELSEEQLSTVIDFANKMYNSYTRENRSMFSMTNRDYFNPFMQNVEEKEKGGLRVREIPTYERIASTLVSDDGNFGSLQSYSDFFALFDSIYSNILKYIGGLLAFDLSISCKNIENVSEYNSKEYKEDLQRVYKFLDNFKYKHEFTKVVKQIARYGVNFVWFRDSKCSYKDDENALEKDANRSFALQQMPQQRCIITGIYNKGIIGYDFDLSYFEQEVDIKLYDNTLILKYNKLYKGNNGYKPSNKITRRNDMYGTYTQTSPLDGAYCFKLDDETMMITPPFSSLMKSVLDNETVNNLQKDKDMLSAYYLLAGEIGMMQTKSGEKQNQTKFSPDVLGKLLSLVTSGLKNNVKTIAMPSENIRGWQYNDQNPKMADNQLKKTSSQGISASKLIYNPDTATQSVIQNSIMNDYNYWSRLYYQFETFLEFFVNQKTKKYKFSFNFTGSNYTFEREERKKGINELATLGLTLNTSAWASAYGYEPQVFDRMLQEARYGDMQDKLSLLMNKNIMVNGLDENNQDNTNNNSSNNKQESTQENKQDVNTITSEDKGGRPTLEDSQISDSGEQSRDIK